MSRIKQVIAGVVVAALIAGAASGGAMYIKKSNEKEVLVVSVSSLASSYYSDDTYLDGTVTTNVSQSVSVDDDMVVQDVYVQKGDSVKKGDTLITFDVTLVEMELNIAKLKKEQQEQELTKAKKRLTSLQNGGPIEESDSSTSLSTESDDLSTTYEEDDASAAVWSGNYLASSISPILLAAAIGDVFSDTGSAAADSALEQSGEGEDVYLPDTGSYDDLEADGTDIGEGSGSEFSSGSDFISGELDPPAATPTPTPLLESEDDVPYFNESTAESENVFQDGTPVFYTKLDGDSVPYTGRGSEEEPYIFLCSSATGSISVTGEFLNLMAGFSKDGTRVLSEKGYWYQIEFHERDTITNFEDRKESCIGYYLMDGTLLETPVNGLAEMEFTVDGADTYEEELPGEDPGDYEVPGSDDTTSVLSRADAIKQQKSRISELELDIQESDINISKLEKKVQKQTVYSKIDGVVSYVGDSLTGSSGSAFLVIRSKDGYYVKGTVSELMLDEVQEGTILNCSSYDAGESFEAEVTDVSDYPVSSSNYYYGDGNPNVSYYTFSASVLDESVKLSESDWLNITLQNQVSETGSFVLEKAFVLTENGTSYVYKDDNGVLKKQVLKVGGNVNGGYSVLVEGGLSRDDKIAFPYGKTVQEGAKTREGTIDELYGY